MNDQELTLNTIYGHLDLVTEDGIVEGWCWDQSQPGRRVDVSILVEGLPIGSTLAMLFREDLKQAGMGDGCYKFRFILPYSVLGQKRTLKVSLRDTQTGLPIGAPYLLHQKAVATIDERIVELEGKIRLLQSRLTEMKQQSARDSGAAAASLFETVGAFFMQLAEEAQSGAPVTAVTRLGALVQSVAASYKTLILPHPEVALATICIEACAPLAEVYACIAALASTGTCEFAHIVVLDPGAHEDAALLPVIIRNLRYIRTRDDLLAERNLLAREAATDLVIFMAAHAHVTADWFTEIRQTFEDRPAAGAVGAKIAREDGILEHAGLLVQESQRLADIGAGRIDGDPDCNFARTVDALGDYAVAYRRQAFLAAGGFDPALLEPAAAVLDVCFHLREKNFEIVYQPLARVLWRDGRAERERFVVEDLGFSSAGFYDLLRLNWAQKFAALAAERRGAEGPVLFMPGEDWAADMQQMAVLQAEGKQLVYGLVFASDRDEDYRALARQGVQVLSTPFYGSFEEYLQKAGEGLGAVFMRDEDVMEARLDGLRHLLREPIE